MTLPTSGPLSLSDIQTEFGGSNPIQLSEYYAGGGLVPAGTTGTYGAVPSSGAIGIQNFYGTSNIRNFSTLFVAESSASDTILNSWGTVINSSNQAYTFGTYSVTLSGGAGYITSYKTVQSANNGDVVSNLAMAVDTGVGSYTTLQSAPAIDSSNNVYTLYYAAFGGGNQILKYDSSNNLVWSYIGLLNTSLSATHNSYGFKTLAVSANGNIYFGGRNSPGLALIVAWTSTPSFSWAKTITTGSNPYFETTGVSVDSGNNVYVAGWGYNSGTGASYVSFLVKFNSAGTVQWQRRVGSTNTVSTGCYTDASDNTYTYGTENTSGYTHLIKVDASGTVLWKVDIQSPVNSTITGVVVDASGNVYGVASAQTGKLIVFKLNSAGTRQWTRVLDSTNTYAQWRAATNPSITLDTTGAVIITAGLSIGSAAFNDTYVTYLFRLAADGTGVPQTITNTVGIGGITNSVIDYYDQTVTFPASSIGFATVTLTYAVVTSASFTSSGTFTTYTESIPYGSGSANINTVTIT